MQEPTLINGGIHIDDRGTLTFANDFNFSDVKRFYTIENHSVGFVRAWHGHKLEAKYFMCVKGSFVVGAVHQDYWESSEAPPAIPRYVLSDSKPQLLYIPEGYANGQMSLTEGAKLIVFSTTSLDSSLNDDYRFDARKWDIWQVEER